MLGHRMRMPSGPRGLTIAASASGTSFTMESLFTPTQWTSTTAKKVTVPVGVQLGSSNSSAAITIGATAWGGDLTLEVSGTISGSGGAAGTAGAGGVGGNAVDANRLGASSQKLIVNILSGGIIRGGGGGGGKGGAGGSGVIIITEGPIYQSIDPVYYWRAAATPYGYWNGGQAFYGSASPTQITVGAYTYYRGVLAYSNFYKISRTSNGSATSGGTGGSGARGQGYDGSSASGSAGAAGGTNAGTGGTGGAGAAYGATGTTGSTGASGNVGAGVAGSSGGLAGYYVANAANATITNAGTVQGR